MVDPEEEITLEPEKPAKGKLKKEKSGAQRIVEHFAAPGPDDVHKEAIQELETKISVYLQKKALCEKLEAELAVDRDTIIMRSGVGTSQIGKHIVTVKEEERQGSVDYKRLLSDREITEDILAQYRKPKTQYKKLEIRSLS